MDGSRGRRVRQPATDDHVAALDQHLGEVGGGARIAVVAPRDRRVDVLVGEGGDDPGAPADVPLGALVEAGFGYSGRQLPGSDVSESMNPMLGRAGSTAPSQGNGRNPRVPIWRAITP